MSDRCEYFTKSTRIGDISNPDGAVSISMTDEGTHITFDNTPQTESNRFHSNHSSGIVTLPLKEKEEEPFLSSSITPIQDPRIPVIVKTAGYFKELSVIRGKSLELTLNNDVYIINTVPPLLLVNGKEVRYTQKSGQIREGKNLYGPCCIWLLSFDRKTTPNMSIWWENNVFNAKCDQECIVLGVNMKNFNTL